MGHKCIGAGCTFCLQTKRVVKEIEKQIAEHQQVQMTNPPSSKQWQNASEEINRLAALIVEAQKK